jgi:hypothetical protein
MMLLLAEWQSEGKTSDVTASFATLRDLAVRVAYRYVGAKY